MTGDNLGDAYSRKRAKRASNPCDACRHRKTRCVTKDDNAVCTMCELRDSPCTYSNSDRRRNHSVTQVQSPEGDTNTLNINKGRPSTISESEAGWQLDTVTSERTAMFESGNLPARVGDRTLGAETHRFAELYGLTSDAEPLLMVSRCSFVAKSLRSSQRHRPYDPARQEYSLETHSMRRVHTTDNGVEYPVAFHMVDDAKALGYTGEFTETDAIEATVTPFGPRLIRLYWLLVHPSFPLLAQQRFMQQYETSYRGISSALLGAVYLQALAWWSYDSELSLRSPPNTVKLRKLTLEAMQNAFHRPRLSSIQAMLIYLHCRPDEPLTADHTYARGLTSQMLAVSEAMGLHLDATAWSIPAWEKAERKRLSWAIYMQDKWTALTYGRPSHVKDDDWDVSDLKDSDFEVESDQTRQAEISTGSIQYMLMVDLTKILSTVLTTFYTIRGSKEQDTSKLFEMAQPSIQALSTLRQRLLTLLPITPQVTRHLSSVGA
jgi:hypothetical protein